MLGLYNVTGSVPTTTGSTDTVRRVAPFNAASGNNTFVEDVDLDERKMPNEVTVF